MRSRRSPSRRLLVTALVSIVVLVGGAMVVRAVWFRDQARAVAVDDAVERFRNTATTDAVTTVAVTTDAVTTDAGDSSSTTDDTTSLIEVTSTSISLTVPRIAPGVYRYLTTGGERIDAVGGTSHEYPSETALTVTTSGCGVWLRWDILQERREEWHLCATDEGVALQPVGTVYHEFFGVGETEDLRCDRAVVLVPLADSAPPVALDCMLADLAWLPVWEVLGRDTIAVNGAEIDVWHVRMTIVDEDDYPEETTIEWWLAASGLPLRMTSVTTSTSASDLVGDVRYEEEYVAELVSLEPLS